MNGLLHQVQRYLHDALGIDVTATAWQGVGRLPHFLLERYQFAEMQLLEAGCLLVVDTNPAETSPAAVRKHLDLLDSRHAGQPIYVRAQVTAYNRKRLVEQKVPFIVPANQMYLPMLGIDLREHFRRLHAEVPVFSPATQVFILDLLLNDRMHDELIPKEAARRLGYSPMTMTRVFDELQAVDLGATTMRGRQRRLSLTGTRRSLWEKAQAYLQTPVTKRLFIPRSAAVEGPRAGYAALADCTALAAPARPVVAISRAAWTEHRRGHNPVEVPADDPDAQEVEVWSYAPALFAREDRVDPLSLYLSLKDDPDERTQASLSEMMGNVGW